MRDMFIDARQIWEALDLADEDTDVMDVDYVDITDDDHQYLDED